LKSRLDLPSIDRTILRTVVLPLILPYMISGDPIAEQAHELGAVVASLSLHYFSWEEALAITQGVRDVLRPGGMLLCRLNSTENQNLGAPGTPLPPAGQGVDFMMHLVRMIERE